MPTGVGALLFHVLTQAVVGVLNHGRSQTAPTKFFDQPQQLGGLAHAAGPHKGHARFNQPRANRIKLIFKGFPRYFQKFFQVFSTRSIIPIRYAETDRMGVVHHSNYPIYFEAGRTDFFIEHLIHYHEMESQGLFAPILELKMELVGRASYGDTLILQTFPAWLKGLKISMRYDVTLEGGAPVARGETVHALCGPDLRPLHPRNFKDLYGLLQRVFP